MGITVRRASTGNWLVIDDYYVTHWDGSVEERGLVIWSEHFIRTYTCTNWTDAMRIADDLANERTIDPNRIIALSERRV